MEVLQGQQELSIQEAYTPHSTCFGCGMTEAAACVCSQTSLVMADGDTYGMQGPRLAPACSFVASGLTMASQLL